MATMGATISLRPNGPEPAILGIIDRINDQSQLPAFLEIYIEHSGIDPDRFTEPVRAAMVEYLLDRGVRFEADDAVDRARAGEYDELFALAYEHAVERSEGRSDPIDAARQPGGGPGATAWDFSVDTFEEIEQQAVVRENILAAGALDYIYELGERLGIFPLMDAFLLDWVSGGGFDAAERSLEARMYRNWKLRDERASAEERGMLYRRVLNKGTTEVLSRMVVAEAVPQVWHNLMSDVADFIDKTERVSEGAGELSPVSRRRIYETTKSAQYVLTSACTGMAHVQIRELYAHLQECLEILGHPEVLDHFGGRRRKGLRTVVEELSRREFGVAPNVNAHFALATEGNKIFRWIANFDAGRVRQEDFAAFLEAAESYILNFSAVGDAPARETETEDEPPEDDAEAETDEF